jgi:hypothetical protein
MKSVSGYFLAPTLIAVALFIGVLYGFGTSAFITVVILSILEVTLSFDNAVVNARVLRRMDAVWQQRFLTWGILLAVVGTRFILPIVIVSVAIVASPLYVAKLAIADPEAYSNLLEQVHASITAFGGIFLLMVSLKYFFDTAKDVHWIASIERHLSKWGHIEAIEIVIALCALLTLSYVSHFPQATILVSGVIGLILFILMEGIAGSLSVESDMARSGLSLFLYLNVLDSAFSLDGVIGAFALTSNLIIIMIGLGIGAYFVRSLTVYFVRENTLAELTYLEHGAHWAVFGLAFAMLANLVVHVPEIVTGLIGLTFVFFAYISSRREKKDLATV